MNLKEISEKLSKDSVIEKLVNGETLTLEELFMFKNSLEKKIQSYILNK